MTSTFSLGKNGKFGEIDFSKLRSGITKEELGIQKGSVLESIWESIDTNQTGESKDKLDRQELQAFIEKIKTLCGKDTNLSTGEAKKYVYGEDEKGKELKLGRKNKEELLTFLSKLSELTKGIANVETEATTNIETITYEDGHKEQIKPDGSKVIISKDGKTITEKDANDYTTKETVKTDNEETVTEFEANSTNPRKQTITGNGVKSVILYAKGKPIKKTTTNTETGVVQEFEYVNGNEVLKKTTNPNNGEITTHNGNNSTTTTTTEEGTTIIERNGDSVTRKKTTTQTEQGEQISDITYDGENFTENISIDGKPRSQKMVIDGITYEVNYDEDGNTLGVIVQNGESIQAIADKFGVSPEALVKANANLLKGRRYFMVGEQIKIPRQINADEFARLQEGRQTREQSISAYNQAVAERQARIGTEIRRSDNDYYVTQTSDNKLHYWNPEKKEITPEEFQKNCPNLYEEVTNTQRGATKRTHKIYDTDTIKSQSRELAKKIHDQISGASKNENTINMLRGITPENVAFVVSEYKEMYNVSLAQDIDDEWNLDLNTVKEHICKKLVEQAKSLGIEGIYYGDYQKINDLKTLQTWIDNAASKIREFMSNATETYYATDTEETQRESAAEVANTAKTSAQQIVKDLIEFTNWSNDIDKIKATIARIDSPEELEEVNRLLTLKGYPPTDKYSPIEHFIYDETDHSISHTYNSSDYLEQTVQNWIDNGTLTGQAANEAQARMAARVLFDGGDGFGTDCDKIRKAIRMIKCPKPTGNREADNAQAREVYRLVNEMIKKHNTFYGMGSPCTDLLDYCKGEMWDSEVKYLNGILAETNAIQGDKKAQAVTDLTQEAVEGGGTDIEYLEQAIRGIDSPEDRINIEEKLRVYCERKGIKPQIEGQAYLQAILYDECDTFMGISTDHKEIRKFNEMLIAQGAYTDEEAVNLRAEQAVLQILEGDFDNIKDAVEQLKDPQVLAKVEQLLTTKGYASLDDFLSKKLDQTKSDLINAELASNNLLPNEKAADVAFRLIKNSDFNKRAQGIRAIRNEEVAKLVDEKLKSEGSSLAKVMEQFNKEKAEYKSKAEFWNGLGKFISIAGVLPNSITEAYKSNTDSSDNMFVEMGQAQNLTAEQKASYLRTVQIMEQKLEQMEKDYQAALDGQGAVSWYVNQFCERWGIGTTREEIEARIEHDKETVRLLKLAAEGKLGKMVDGQTVAVSFEEVFKERNINTTFKTENIEKVEKQAQTLVAMNYAKTNIAVCWEELENGLNSSDSKRLSLAIIDTLEKLSNMKGEELSLAGYGYSIKNSTIIDENGNPVSVERLKELANILKRGLADITESLFGEAISLDTSSSDINDVLDKLYNNKKESFKEEFKEAFGQDCPDEMIEDYISTIETGNMVVNMGALIGAVVAAPFTGGGSLAVFTAAAGTSLGLSALEHSTDSDGWTNMEWTSDAEQAMWDGIMAALGMKVGISAEAKAIGAYKTAAQNMLKKFVPNITEKTLNRASICIARVRAMGYEISSDTIQSLAQTYCQHGEFDEEAFVRDLLMSVAGNTVGHAVGGIGDARGSKANTDVGADVDAPEERAAIDRNNAEAAEANAEAHQIGNNVDEASADALRRARENAHEVDNTQNGVFKDNLGNEYTLTDGKITEIRTSEGRVINDELKIAKFTTKRNINLAELGPVKTDVPDANPHADGPENVRVDDEVEAEVVDEPENVRVDDEVEVEVVDEPENVRVDDEIEVEVVDEPENVRVDDEVEVVAVDEPENVRVDDEVEVEVVDEPENVRVDDEVEVEVVDEPESVRADDEVEVEVVDEPENVRADDEVEVEVVDANSPQNVQTHNFTKSEIDNFANISAKNVRELEEKLKPLGFEREMIGDNGFIVTPNGEILCSFINKNTGIRYVFSADGDIILPKRIISFDGNTNAINYSVEFKRNNEGEIVDIIEKNRTTSSNTHSVNSDDIEVVAVDEPESVRVDDEVEVEVVDEPENVRVDDEVEVEVVDEPENVRVDDEVEVEVVDEPENVRVDDEVEVEVVDEPENVRVDDEVEVEVVDEPENVRVDDEVEVEVVDEPENVRVDDEIEVEVVDEPENVRVDDEVEAEVVDATPHVDEPKSSLNDPVKAAGLRRKLGANLFAVYQAVERGIDTLNDISSYNKLKSVIANKFKDSPTEFSELMSRLNNKAKKVGLDVEENVHNNHGRIDVAAQTPHSHTSSVANSSVDFRLRPNSPQKVNTSTKIRLANRVDIDLKDLSDKFNQMKDGDFFIIGRNVSGPNDICINNRYVSSQHLRVEKINGEIYVTDLSSKNGTILNSTQADYAAQWKPDLNFSGYNSNDFQMRMDKYYDELRRGNYTYEASIRNITDNDIELPYIFEDFRQKEFCKICNMGGWSLRVPNKNYSHRNWNPVDRVSLNVVADKECLRELDMLLEKGEYINKNGQRVKIKVPVAEYKTPASLNEWCERHDPITMYFAEKISPELEQAIAEITEKYARTPSNGKALMNNLEGKPWISHEPYVDPKDAQNLYKRAMELNPELAKTISNELNDAGDWNCSSGQFAAAKRLVDEYEMSLS